MRVPREGPPKEYEGITALQYYKTQFIVKITCIDSSLHIHGENVSLNPIQKNVENSLNKQGIFRAHTGAMGCIVLSHLKLKA